MTRLNEGLLELFYGRGILDGINLCSGNHTVTNLCLREIQGILEESRVICDNHHDLSEEDFSHTVDEMLQNTNQITTLLDKLMSEAQGCNENGERRKEEE